LVRASIRSVGKLALFLISYVTAPGGAIAALIELKHCEVSHESIWGRTVPVLLTGLEEDAVTGSDNFNRSTATLRASDALNHVGRLHRRTTHWDRSACQLNSW
jgi:hypothetical protein